MTLVWEWLARPWRAAIAIGALAEALFCWRLTIPHKLVFDETHYVSAARTLLQFSHPQNIEHPLLAKTLIALGIALFGDNSLGWRLLSTFAGTAVVVGIFAIGWLIWRELRPAVVASLLALLNFTVFIQARIGMLDGFMAAFVVGALAALLWAMRGSGAAVWRRWLAGSVLLGLATACKWTAAPYVAYAAVAFVLLRRGHSERWPGLGVAPAIAILGTASVLTYFVTFWPAFLYQTDPLTFASIVPFQLEMYRQQTQVLPPHTYQSAWYSWPLVIRPIWYLYENVDGAQRGILMLGNPAVMWGGLVAVLICLWGWVRERSAAMGAVAGLWLGSYLIWAAIPKSLGFFYYYYLPSIWLPLAITAAFDRYDRERGWDEYFLVASAVLFVWFYPILSAAALHGPQSFQRWMWFSTWP